MSSLVSRELGSIHPCRQYSTADLTTTLYTPKKLLSRNSHGLIAFRSTIEKLLNRAITVPPALP
jgi:hypothetical protein